MNSSFGFFFKDCIEMRRNKWMPRKIGKTPEGPRTIHLLRLISMQSWV